MGFKIYPTFVFRTYFPFYYFIFHVFCVTAQISIYLNLKKLVADILEHFVIIAYKLHLIFFFKVYTLFFSLALKLFPMVSLPCLRFQNH